MPSHNTKSYSLILMAADAIVLAIVFAAAYYIRTQIDQRVLLHIVYAYEYIIGFAVITPVWILIFASLGLYSPSIYNRRLVEWSRITLGTFIGILLVIGWEYFTSMHIFPARLVALYVLIGSTIAIILVREIIRTIRNELYRYGHGVSRVLVIGNSDATTDIAMSLGSTHKSGYQIVAFAGPAKLLPPHLGIVHYGRVETALKDIKKLNISTIIQTDLYASEDRNHQILSAAQIAHIQYNFIPGEPEFYTGKNTVDVFLGYPMITVSQTPLIGWGAIAKRLFDLVAVIITLPLWGWLNLSEHEYVIQMIPRHSIGIWGPTFAMILAIILVSVFMFCYPDIAKPIGLAQSMYPQVILICLMVIILFGIGLYIAIWVYMQNRFFLTNESVIQEIQISLFSKREQTVSLMNIEDSSYSQKGILQTLFNYGSIRLSTEGDETKIGRAHV